MKRDEAESGLEFIGFIIFENKLKESTGGVLDELTEAGIRTVMCTGDNILTAISVARECNLIAKTAHCFVPHFVEGMKALCFLGAQYLTAIPRRLSGSQSPFEVGEYRQQHFHFGREHTHRNSSQTSKLLFADNRSRCHHLSKETRLFLTIYLIFVTIL